MFIWLYSRASVPRRWEICFNMIWHFVYLPQYESLTHMPRHIWPRHTHTNTQRWRILSDIIFKLSRKYNINIRQHWERIKSNNTFILAERAWHAASYRRGYIGGIAHCLFGGTARHQSHVWRWDGGSSLPVVIPLDFSLCGVWRCRACDVWSEAVTHSIWVIESTETICKHTEKKSTLCSIRDG